jgi:hypothetical protein
MNYARSPTLNQALSLDGHPIDPGLVMADRKNLVEQFNTAVGPPGEVGEAVQRDFISGKMPYEDMVSYVHFCEYMIRAAQDASKSQWLLLDTEIDS